MVSGIVRVQGVVHSAADMTLSKAAALARRAALRKIRDAERDEEKLKAEGKLEKRYRSQPYYCVACDGAPQRKMQCLYPPICGEHVKSTSPVARPPTTLRAPPQCGTARRAPSPKPSPNSASASCKWRGWNARNASVPVACTACRG